MSVTELTSHPEMSALNADAPRNMAYMFVTELTFHLSISSVPAAPQFAPLLQHATPVASIARQLSTAALSAVLSANGAASVPGTHATMSTEKEANQIPIFFGGRVRVRVTGPRDARPKRCTPEFSRPCEFDAGSETAPSLRTPIFSRFRGVDAGRPARPGPFARRA